jgi:Domain of unknown function (DUF4340)
MKLQRSTLALLGIAVVLATSILIFESQKAQKSTSETASATDPTGMVADKAKGEKVVSFLEEDVQSLTIQRVDTTLSFTKDSAGLWQMNAPQKAPAEPAAIAFLLDILTSDPAIQTLEATAADLAGFGLTSPKATLTLTLADGSTHTLAVGDTDFTGDSRYVQVLEPLGKTDAAQPIPVYVVSGGITNGIERPVAEWLAPKDPGVASTPETAPETAPSTPETAPSTPDTTRSDPPSTPSSSSP